MKKTKIICTIGPSCDNNQTIKEMILSGMNVARFNMSHGTHESHLKSINKVREVREELGVPVSIMIDTKGPEVRVKDFKNKEEFLTDGQKFVLTTKNVEGTKDIVSITYKDFPSVVKKDTRILVNDGLVELKVTKVTDTDVETKVIVGGKISNKKAINVPNVDLKMPYISDVDREDIKFACEQKADYIAISFVSCAEDVKEVKKLLKKFGRPQMKIISKIENSKGVKNAHEILEESDGLMVARGDLGVEVDFQKIPIIQKQLIAECNNHRKLAVTATQMLESMTTNSRPTRAEISDVANAIIDGTTAIMLSGETSAGLHPVLAVKTMAQIATETEKATNQDEFSYFSAEDLSVEDGFAYGVCAVAYGEQAGAIVCDDYLLAQKIASFRPSEMVVYYSKEKDEYNQSSLLYNMISYYREKSVEDVCKKIKAEKLVSKDCAIIVTTNNTIRVMK